MTKLILFTTLALLLFSACGSGEKSVIKGGPKSQSLATEYGDGVFIYPEAFIPLTEIDEVASEVPDLGVVLSGFARTFMNIGVGLGAGKKTMSLVQPIPEIPRNYLKDIHLKRVFFYIEPHTQGVRRFDWLTRIFKGKGDVNFDFLSKMAIMIRTHHIGNRQNWRPIFNLEEKVDKQTQKKLQGYFKTNPGESLYPRVPNPKKAREMLILKYDKKHASDYLRNQDYGDIFIATTTSPVETKNFLLDHPEMGQFFEHIFILNKTLMIELKKDPVVSESFNVVISRERENLDSLGVTFIEQCTPKTCLDLKVPEVSLIDLISTDNAVKLDAFMEANEVPETFRLKGFIEFKMKVKTPI